MPFQLNPFDIDFALIFSSIAAKVFLSNIVIFVAAVLTSVVFVAPAAQALFETYQYHALAEPSTRHIGSLFNTS